MRSLVHRVFAVALLTLMVSGTLSCSEEQAAGDQGKQKAGEDQKQKGAEAGPKAGPKAGPLWGQPLTPEMQVGVTGTRVPGYLLMNLPAKKGLRLGRATYELTGTGKPGELLVKVSTQVGQCRQGWRECLPMTDKDQWTKEKTIGKGNKSSSGLMSNTKEEYSIEEVTVNDKKAMFIYNTWHGTAGNDVPYFTHYGKLEMNNGSEFLEIEVEPWAQEIGKEGNLNLAAKKEEVLEVARLFFTEYDNRLSGKGKFDPFEFPAKMETEVRSDEESKLEISVPKGWIKQKSDVVSRCGGLGVCPTCVAVDVCYTPELSLDSLIAIGKFRKNKGDLVSWTGKWDEEFVKTKDNKDNKIVKEGDLADGKGKYIIYKSESIISQEYDYFVIVKKWLDDKDFFVGCEATLKGPKEAQVEFFLELCSGAIAK